MALVWEFQFSRSYHCDFCRGIINPGPDRKLTLKNKVTDLYLACSRNVASTMRMGETMSSKIGVQETGDGFSTMIPHLKVVTGLEYPQTLNSELNRASKSYHLDLCLPVNNNLENLSSAPCLLTGVQHLASSSFTPPNPSSAGCLPSPSLLSPPSSAIIARSKRWHCKQTSAECSRWLAMER